MLITTANDVAEHQDQAGLPASSGIFAIAGEARLCKQKRRCVARGMLTVGYAAPARGRR